MNFVLQNAQINVLPSGASNGMQYRFLDLDDAIAQKYGTYQWNSKNNDAKTHLANAKVKSLSFLREAEIRKEGEKYTLSFIYAPSQLEKLNHCFSLCKQPFSIKNENKNEENVMKCTANDREPLLELYSHLKENFQRKKDLTHFVMLPIVDPDVVQKLKNLQKILKEDAPSITANHLMKEKRFHFTVLLLSIEPSQIEKATQALQRTQSIIYDLLNTQTLLVNLNGCLTFRSCDSVNVIYTTDSSSKFHETINKIARVLKSEFDKEGIHVAPDQHSGSEHQVHSDILVSHPHVTLVNKKYDSSHPITLQGSDLRRGSRFVIGQCRIPRIELCEISSGSSVSPDQYNCISSIHLP